VNVLEGRKASIHAALARAISGQLRFLGSNPPLIPVKIRHMKQPLHKEAFFNRIDSKQTAKPALNRPSNRCGLAAGKGKENPLMHRRRGWPLSARSTRPPVSFRFRRPGMIGRAARA
jgi:hypothetical protein